MTLQVVYKVAIKSEGVEVKTVEVDSVREAEHKVDVMLRAGYRDITAELSDDDGEVIREYARFTWSTP